LLFGGRGQEKGKVKLKKEGRGLTGEEEKDSARPALRRKGKKKEIRSLSGVLNC